MAILEFDIHFLLVELVPALSAGVLLASGTIFLYLSVLTRSRLHLSMLLVTSVAFVLVSSQLLAILFANMESHASISAQFYRVEQLMGAFFIAAIPIFMYGLSDSSTDRVGVHRTISLVAIAVVAALTIAAFFQPGTFVSVSESAELVDGALFDTRRTAHGPLKIVRDGLLIAGIGYLLFSLGASLREGKRRLLVPMFIALSLAALSGLDDLWQAYTGVSLLTGSVPLIQRFPAGITLFILTATATVIFVYVRDAEKVGRMRDRLSYLVYYDQLTGLRNRRNFYERLRELCHRTSTRSTDRLAVLLVDLDRFKGINDTLGHEIGDQLLVEVRDRLSSHAPSADSLFRVGGDEFSLLVPDISDVSEAEQIAVRIIAAMRFPFSIRGRIIYIGCTIGVSVYPDDGDPEALIRHADTALGAAKQDRNTYRCYTSEMQRNTSRTMSLLNELRHALSSNELYLRYQPQASPYGEVSGIEVLARWQNDTLGHVSPVSFIPVAEETGLIIPIGYWVLEQACMQLKRWIDAGLRTVPIAVNVSAKQLNDPDFASRVLDILHSRDIPPELLHMEITESVLLAASSTISDSIGRLVECGLPLVVDDFGVGYSSLAYIRRLPISAVKLDRSFLLDVPRDARDCQLVRGTHGLMSGLGLKMIAEGAETEEQVAFLQQIGSHMQGFQIKRPIDADAMTRLLSSASVLAEK